MADRIKILPTEDGKFYWAAFYRGTWQQDGTANTQDQAVSEALEVLRDAHDRRIAFAHFW